MPLTDPSHDNALLSAMQGGDAGAFEALYRRHQPALFRFAALRSGSADTAADIVQDVFMALMTGALRFDPTRGALQGFLLGVARNFALKREEARQRFVAPRAGDEDDPADALEDAAPGPLERLLAHREAEAVRRALATLKPHYRDVVILYELHDLTYVEIAQVCNIDIGTVRSRLSRARARLAELLANDFNEAAPQRAAGQSHEARP